MAAFTNKNEFAFKLPEMMSYHSTWEDADYEPVLPRRRNSWVARAADTGRRWLHNRMERVRVMNELKALDDRALADLGLTRYDIGRVFDKDFVAEHAERSAGRY